MIRDLCFEVIQKCPNECVFCSSNSNYACTEVISYPTFERVIDGLSRDYGIVEVSLSGGEPLLHGDIVAMVRKLSSLGIKSRLYTSGVVQADKISLVGLDCASQCIAEKLNTRKFSAISLEKLLELKQAGLDTLVISLHSGSEDTYNHIMGTRGLFADTIKSLLNARRASLDTEVHYVPVKCNKNELESVLELCSIAEIETLSVLKLMPQGRAKCIETDLVLSAEELQELIAMVQVLQPNYSTKVRLGLPITGTGHDCTAGFDKFSIRYDGQVFPCVAFKNCTQDTSDFFKVTSIYETLDGFKPVERFKDCQMCHEIYKTRED